MALHIPHRFHVKVLCILRASSLWSTVYVNIHCIAWFVASDLSKEVCQLGVVLSHWPSLVVKT